MADEKYCDVGCPACDIRRIVDNYLEAGADPDAMLLLMLEVINETFSVDFQPRDPIQVH